MIHLRRRLFKTQTTGAITLRELLQSMFVSELLAPETERTNWVVSPWISDIPVVDNRSGSFDQLNPEWGRREVRLAEVLAALVMKGSPLVVVTRSVETNLTFLQRLEELTGDAGVREGLRVVKRQDLHVKGIVLSRCQLFGSMNFTFNGLEILEESVEFCADIADVAGRRNEFADAYGDESR